MSIYDDLRAVTSQVMSEFKQGTVYYVPVATVAGATPDAPASSGKGTPVLINATVRPVSTNYVDGTHVVQTDKQVVVPNDGTIPTMQGFVRIDGVDHKIIVIMARPAAGDPIAWTVIVRR